MSDPSAFDDDLLLSLREVIDVEVQPSRSMVDMIMAGYDITHIEASLAELVEDLSVGAATGVRAGDNQPRLVTCSSDDLTFEFEIRPQAPEIVGQIDPPAGGTVHLDQSGDSQAMDLGQLADFEFALRTSHPFRLRYEPVDGLPTVTDWILP